MNDGNGHGNGHGNGPNDVYDWDPPGSGNGSPPGHGWDSPDDDDAVRADMSRLADAVEASAAVDAARDAAFDAMRPLAGPMRSMSSAIRPPDEADSFQDWWPGQGPEVISEGGTDRHSVMDIDAEMAMAAALARAAGEAKDEQEAALSSKEAIAASSALSDRWARAVIEAQLTLSPRGPVKLPWERGFAAAVFCNKQVLSNKVFDAERSVQPAAPPNIDESEPPDRKPWDNMGLSGSSRKDMAAAWPVAAHRVSSLDWAEHENSKRQVALSRWKLILCENIGASGVGRMLVRDHLSLQSQENVTNTLRDIFAKKSTATLSKRAASLGNYVALQAP
jgi:Tfp pilus assembly protein PilV